ncbi:MAG TPA: OmpA family protein [Stellaceae bacterium]|nr:OmpA family protein [Stellaceae bacterium]
MRRVAILLALLLAAQCASEPAGPHRSTVFFETDDAAITPEGQQVVAQIAAEALRLNPSKIIVEGRADGGTPHDATLADQRAAAVMRALTAAGIDATRIEKRPSVPPPGWGGIAAHQAVITLLP